MTTTTKTPETSSIDANVVIVEWDDLMMLQQQQHNHQITDESVVTAKLKIIQDAIERSYCRNGIGIMAVRGVPNFVPLKDQFLIQAHTLATQLTEEYREENLTDVASLYNAGWSYGKEQLGHDKPPDTSKGSFYYNPIVDTPGTEQDRIQYPFSYPCNKWPNEEMIPNFQQNAKDMGVLLKLVAIEIAKHLDVYVQEKFLENLSPTTQTVNHNEEPPRQQIKPISIYQHLKDTDKVKARLLYYYPLPMKKSHTALNTEVTADIIEDSWIGWHNDSGFLTALAGEIYVDHSTGERLLYNVDPNSGLYVIDRRHNNSSSSMSTNTNGANQSKHDNDVPVLKVNIPYDCCAIQIGECLQIVTCGILCATPHCVRACRATATTNHNVARISLPCFIDTHPSFPLRPPLGISRQQVLMADNYSHSKVPPLSLRWKSPDDCDILSSVDATSSTTIRNATAPMTFGEFLQETFQLYYGWESKASILE
jgi:hypothetical protein